MPVVSWNKVAVWLGETSCSALSRNVNMDVLVGVRMRCETTGMGGEGA